MSDPQLIIGTETLYIHVSLNDHSESVTLGFPFTVCSYSEMYRSPEGKRESFLFSCDPKKNNWLFSFPAKKPSEDVSMWERKSHKIFFFFSFCVDSDISSLGFTDVKTSSVFPSLWNNETNVWNKWCVTVWKKHTIFFFFLWLREKKNFFFYLKLSKIMKKKRFHKILFFERNWVIFFHLVPNNRKKST